MRRLVVLGLALVLGLAFVPALAPTRVAHANGYSTHVVTLGETLSSIAGMYGVSAEAIAQANGIVNPDYIYAGQVLTIPGSYMPPSGGYQPPPPPQSGGHYVVRLGDSLYGIAAMYGTTISALMATNGISNPNYIYAGQVLVIPGSYSPPPPQGPWPEHYPPPHGRPDSDFHCGYYYVVRPGDTLSVIALRHGTTMYAIARANGLRYPFTIYAGERLHIPCDGGTVGLVADGISGRGIF
jgi:LysM repeat protein